MYTCTEVKVDKRAVRNKYRQTERQTDRQTHILRSLGCYFILKYTEHESTTSSFLIAVHIAVKVKSQFILLCFRDEMTVALASLQDELFSTMNFFMFCLHLLSNVLFFTGTEIICIRTMLFQTSRLEVRRNDIDRIALWLHNGVKYDTHPTCCLMIVCVSNSSAS